MSDDIYENADFLHMTTPSNSTAENIYTNEVPIGSQQRAKKGKTQDNSGGHYRCYKLAVVLVCVLLLAVTIALCFTILRTTDLQLKYKNIAEEKDQLQHKYNNVTLEKVQLETNFSAVTAERDQLQNRLGLKTKQCNNITAEKVQLETKFNAERDELQRRLCELESHDMKNIKQHAVNVILDRDTAHPKLILSADGKQVKHGDTEQSLPDTPKRFIKFIMVLGREGFSSGKFYYEVQVKGKTGWTIGVAKESVDRKGEIFLNPTYGLWTIWLRNGTYQANTDSPVTLSLKGKLQRVGVFVDYDAGLVSFYDAGSWNHIYSFTHVSFTEKIYPFFIPNQNDGGKNSAPLIISPVHVCPIK